MQKLLLLLLVTSSLFAQQRVGQIDRDSSATRLGKGWSVLSNVGGVLWMTAKDTAGAVTKIPMALKSAVDLKQDISTLSALVRAVTLTGFSTASSAAVTGSDNVVTAAGKLQKQVGLAVKYTTTTTAEQAYALTADAGTVIIIEIAADEINNSGSPSRYELWPSGNLWWGAFIQLR